VDNVSLKGEIVNESTSSISEDKFNSLSIYPNPGKESLSLILNENVENATISLYSTSGQLVINSIFSGSTTSLNTNNLIEGLYFIELNDGISSSTIKWIKE
jgi:hypothetical protein